MAAQPDSPHVDVRVDQKPEKRVVSKGVARDVLDAEPSCRVCGRPSDHAHHLVRRSQRGDDVVDNMIALCFRCHITKFHDQGDLEVAQQIRRNLLRPEINYILNKKGRAWFDKVYPYNLGSEDPDKLGPSAAYAASESVAPAPPDSSSGQEHSPASDPGSPFPHGSSNGGGNTSTGSDPDSGRPSTETRKLAGVRGRGAKEASHTSSKICKRCAGSGHEPPKPEAPAKKAGKTGVSIKIPKAELAHGADDLIALHRSNGNLLEAELGYDENTPAYYVDFAVHQYFALNYKPEPTE